MGKSFAVLSLPFRMLEVILLASLHLRITSRLPTLISMSVTYNGVGLHAAMHFPSISS